FLAVTVLHLLHTDAVAATEEIPVAHGAGVEFGVGEAGTDLGTAGAGRSEGHRAGAEQARTEQAAPRQRGPGVWRRVGGTIHCVHRPEGDERVSRPGAGRSTRALSTPPAAGSARESIGRRCDPGAALPPARRSPGTECVRWSAAAPDTRRRTGRRNRPVSSGREPAGRARPTPSTRRLP